MKIKVLKLGIACTDKATELKGTLTHWVVNMDGFVNYLFQPKGLDEEGQPVTAVYLCEKRLDVKEDDFEMVEVPFEIIGTSVTDKPSGYNGMAIEFVRYLNGCFHVMIQPKGINMKTKMPIQKRDFDLRSCTGKKIRELSEEKLAASKKKTPSPTGNIFKLIP